MKYWVSTNWLVRDLEVQVTVNLRNRALRLGKGYGLYVNVDIQIIEMIISIFLNFAISIVYMIWCYHLMHVRGKSFRTNLNRTDIFQANYCMISAKLLMYFIIYGILCIIYVYLIPYTIKLFITLLISVFFLLVILHHNFYRIYFLLNTDYFISVLNYIFYYSVN